MGALSGRRPRAAEEAAMKFLRRLTILFLAAVLAAASFATVFAAADGAGATAAPSAAPSDGGADGDASAPQTGAEDEAELSLLLPASYEQYLELNAPSSVAASEDYLAVADGNTIYLYDRVNGGSYKTYIPQNNDVPVTAVGSLNFYDYGNTIYLYYVAIYGGNNQIQYIDCRAENFSEQTAASTQISSCNSFVIVGDNVCYVDADNRIYCTKVVDLDITGSDTPLNISGSGQRVSSLAVYNDTVFFSVDPAANDDYPAIYSVDFNNSTTSRWLTVDHNVTAFAISDGICYYIAAGTLYRAATSDDEELKINDESIRGGSIRLCDDGRLYIISGTSIREFSASGEAFTGYEIARYSSSTNRLGENAADISARSGALLIADTANDRVLQYKDGAYTVLCSADSPTLVCAGDDTFAVYGNSSVSVYTDGGQTVQTYTVRGAVGLAYAYGTFYCVTSANETWAIPADGGSPSEGTLALGSSAAQDLTADVYGRLYVFSGDGNVYRFTADEFLNPGTNLESVAIFSDSVHSVHCAYDGTLYGLSGDALYTQDGTSAPLGLDGLVTADGAEGTDFSFDFEKGTLYVLSDGFIAQGDRNIPSLQTLPAEGTHAALTGGAAEADGLLVEVPAQSVLLDLTEAEIGSDAQFLPYKTYERTDAARTGVKVCETSAGTVVAFFRYAPAQGGNSYTPERKYSLALVLGGVTGPAGGLQAETPFSAHNTSDVYLYRFPSMHLGNGDNAAAGVARLPRGTAFTVHGYVRGAAGGEGGWGLDSDYAYVTVNATGQKGYIPVSYLAEGGVSGGATEFVYRTVDRGESITLFAGSESITLAGRERVKMYGVPDEAGNVYVTYTDADGRVWAGNVPENCLYEAPASATAVLVAVLAVAAVILVSVCYLLLRRQPALD